MAPDEAAQPPADRTEASSSKSSSSSQAAAAAAEDETDWEAVAESCVRVTAAGFAGSLAGLALERQQMSSSSPRQQQQGALPRRPPRMMPLASSAAKNASANNLPTTWAVSCILFALVLESCRWASPTTKLLGHLHSSTSLSSSSSSSSSSPLQQQQQSSLLLFENQVKTRALTSFGDYAFGGTAAGLAGAMGQRRMMRMPGGRPLAAFGLWTGLGLGLLAGTVQAAIDVGNMYLEKEQQAAQQEEEEEEQQRQREQQEQEDEMNESSNNES